MLLVPSPPRYGLGLIHSQEMSTGLSDYLLSLQFGEDTRDSLQREAEVISEIKPRHRKIQQWFFCGTGCGSSHVPQKEAAHALLCTFAGQEDHVFLRRGDFVRSVSKDLLTELLRAGHCSGQGCTGDAPDLCVGDRLDAVDVMIVERDAKNVSFQQEPGDGAVTVMQRFEDPKRAFRHIENMLCLVTFDEERLAWTEMFNRLRRQECVQALFRVSTLPGQAGILCISMASQEHGRSLVRNSIVRNSIAVGAGIGPRAPGATHEMLIGRRLINIASCIADMRFAGA